MIAAWRNPAGGEEYAFAFDRGRTQRLLVLPALFDEANKTRHLMTQVMRRLDEAGVDSFLPDLPGCNESLASLQEQTLESWREASHAAARYFRANRVLTIRAGALLAPSSLPGWRYAPTGGANALRTLLRARTLSAREAGRSESTESLLEQGLEEGLELAGYRLGPAMIRQLHAAGLPEGDALADITQDMIGGSGLWMRAEPDFDAAQADALAAIVATGME